MVNFPTSLDSLSNPTGLTQMDDASYLHHVQHGTLNDIAEALEAKLGIGASTPAANKILTATGSGSSAWGTLVNAMVDAAAAIAYSKLNLASSIVDADIAAAAAIAVSKLAVGTAYQALITDSGATSAVYAASIQSLLTVAGDLLYASSANTPARLAIGTARQVLATNSGATAPEWVASIQSILTAAGDILYASSANTPARLAKGTAFQVLGMNSGATAPEWQESVKSILTTTGDIVYASSANTPARRAIGSVGQVLTVNGSGLPAWVSDVENLLDNGDMIIDQQMQGSAFTSSSKFLNNDDSYTLDQWILLSDGNNAFSVQRETTPANLPTGSRGAAKLVSTTANKKAGLFQILDARRSAQIIGGVASLQLKVWTTGGKAIDNVRVALYSWSSTADSVTSDVVSGAWPGAGSNPTPATNWTLENTPANTAPGVGPGSATTITIENVSIDTASAKNVGVFVWVDDTTIATGDEVYITDCMLVPGPVALPIKRRTQQAELLNCQRYLEVWHPGASGASAAGVGVWTPDGASSVELFDVAIQFIQKRVPPTVSATSLTSSAIGVLSGGAYYTTTTSAIDSFGVFALQVDETTGLVRMDFDIPPGPAAGSAGFLYYTTASIVIDARL